MPPDSVVMLNKNQIYLYLFLATLMFPCISHAQEWKLVSELSEKSYYLDKNSIEYDDDFVYFSTKLIYAVPQNYDYGVIVREEDVWAMNCKERSYKIEDSKDYDQYGEVIKQGMGAFDNLEPIPSGTTIEKLFLEVC